MFLMTVEEEEVIQGDSSSLLEEQDVELSTNALSLGRLRATG